MNKQITSPSERAVRESLLWYNTIMNWSLKTSGITQQEMFDVLNFLPTMLTNQRTERLNMVPEDIDIWDPELPGELQKLSEEIKS